MIEVRPQHLQAICSKMSATEANLWAVALGAAATRFEINVNDDRLGAFIGMVIVESQEFKRQRENLRYMSVRRMKEVFLRLRKYSNAQLQPYVNNPEKFANFIYANRFGNGNEASGDGWRYRGGGAMGLTWRVNYRRIGEAIGQPLEEQPELIERIDISAMAAAAFWYLEGCNAIVDKYEGRKETEMLTLEINGGKTGLIDRIEYTKRADAALKGTV